MINNDAELRNSSEALAELYAALASLRREYLVNSPDTFALLAEGPLREVERIQVEINAYIGVREALRDQSSLWLRLVGPKAKWGEASTSVVTSFLDSLRRGIQAIASHDEAKAGRPSSNLRQACDFEITAFSEGSFEVGVRLPSPGGGVSSINAQKAAQFALREFLAAAAAIADSGASHTQLAKSIPEPKLRRAVLLALKAFVPRTQGGVEYIELSGVEVRSQSRIRLTPKAGEVVSEALREATEEKEETYEGQIREMDLDKQVFMLRRVSPVRQVRCDFPEEMLVTVTSLFGCRVRVTGMRRANAFGRVRRLLVTDLQEVEPEGDEIA